MLINAGLSASERSDIAAFLGRMVSARSGANDALKNDRNIVVGASVGGSIAEIVLSFMILTTANFPPL
jgi:hypothetical protein